MRTHMIEYTNSKGKKIIKTVSDKDLSDWIEALDKRIEKGTCGGYLITANE